MSKKDESAAGMRVLIVEDEEHLRSALEVLVQREDAEAAGVGSLEAARKQLGARAFDAVLCDLTLPDGSGLDLIGHEEALGSPEYIVITGDATAETAVEALKRGAHDYLTKPVDRPRLRSVLASVGRTRELKSEVSGLRSQLRELGRFGPMVGRSEPMQRVYELIERVAPTDAPVFVVGESGTGKELVAETVHALSKRKAKPFLAVNCGAMAPTLIESELFGHEKGSFTGADKRREGFFERAHGGTLLLDEITEMPLELQVKLLRVLEVGAVTRVGATEPTKVDVRVIAASNRDPDEAVAEGDMREDLLYRLNVFPIELPPLRERAGDVPVLAEHFLAQVNAREESEKSLTPRALKHITGLGWPGNVRELKNAVERAAILADAEIDAELFSSSKAPEADAPAATDDEFLRIPVCTPLDEAEKRQILAALRSLDGNKKQTAEKLGISLKTLYNRLNVYEAQDQD